MPLLGPGASRLGSWSEALALTRKLQRLSEVEYDAEGHQPQPRLAVRLLPPTVELLSDWLICLAIWQNVSSYV